MSRSAPEQQIAHTVALASAGTGKTHALTSRYIALLAGGESPERILATTFTRKAAGEILEKVVKRLAEGAADARSASMLAQQTGLRSLTPADCGLMLATLLRNLDRLGVGTIDSFFLRAAACFSMEIGGAPSRLVEDEAAAALRDEALSEVLADGDPADLLALLRMLDQGACSRSVYGSLLRAVEGAHPVFLATDAAAWRAVSEPPGRMSAPDLDSAANEVLRLKLPTTKNGDTNATWQRAIERLVADAQSNDWESFLESGLVGKVAAGKDLFAKIQIPPAVSRCLSPLFEHARSVLLAALADRNLAAWQLLSRFDSAYRRLKMERGLFTFSDIPRLLAECDAFTDLDDLAFRLDAKVSHLLLDEFQDTSLEQWALLEPLADEIIAHRAAGAGGRSFLCVGDAKQSLYSWRGAEPQLLGSLQARWPALTSIDLVESYRSSKVVIGAVNTVFSTLGDGAAFQGKTHDDSAAAAQWAAGFKEHRTTKDLPGFARLAVAPASPDGEDQSLTTIRFTAQRVRDLLAAAPGVSIGVLFRRKKHIRRLKRALHDLGILASEEGGNPLTDSMPVSVAMSMLTLADHPGNSAAHFHVHCSPLGGVLTLPDWHDRPGVRAVCARVRGALLDEGYARTLERWLRDIAPACDRHGLDRFDRLLELAAEFDQSPSLRPTDFVHLVNSRRVEDPAASPVRLMTIHASKGLEFGIVVLPDLDCDIARVRPTVLYQRDRPDGPITAASMLPKDSVLQLDPTLAQMYSAWRSRQVREEICILYVALTRAIYALEMIICPSEKAEGLTFSGILRNTLAPGKPAEPARELWRSGDEHWHSQLPPGAPGRARQSSDNPAAKPIRGLLPRPRSRFLPTRSPSSLGESRISHRRAPLPASLHDHHDARFRGLLFHAWIELIEWLDEGEPDADALRLAACRLGGAPESHGAAAAQFRAALQNGPLRSALLRSRYTQRCASAGLAIQLDVWRERPFVLDGAAFQARVRGGDAPAHDGGPSGDPAGRPPSLLSGRFDRLIIGRDEQTRRAVFAEVLDFKTQRGSGPSDFADQMDAYRWAAATLLGLSEGAVSAEVVHVS